VNTIPPYFVSMRRGPADRMTPEFLGWLEREFLPFYARLVDQLGATQQAGHRLVAELHLRILHALHETLPGHADPPRLIRMLNEETRRAWEHRLEHAVANMREDSGIRHNDGTAGYLRRELLDWQAFREDMPAGRFTFETAACDALAKEGNELLRDFRG
jgi:hypothetical protein